MLARLCLTLGPIGFLPGGGSWASLITMLVAHALGYYAQLALWQLIIISVLFVSALYGIMYARDQFNGRRDPAEIVIDEVVGVLIVFVGIPTTSARLVAGYILFRVFDIYKPWLVARAERLPYAWGIMLDDCVAAIFAWIILQIVCQTGWL